VVVSPSAHLQLLCLRNVPSVAVPVASSLCASDPHAVGLASSTAIHGGRALSYCLARDVGLHHTMVISSSQYVSLQGAQ